MWQSQALMFGTCNFTITLLNCFVLERSIFKTKQLRSLPVKLLVHTELMLKWSKLESGCRCSVIIINKHTFLSSKYNAMRTGSLQWEQVYPVKMWARKIEIPTNHKTKLLKYLRHNLCCTAFPDRKYNYALKIWIKCNIWLKIIYSVIRLNFCCF